MLAKTSENTKRSLVHGPMLVIAIALIAPAAAAFKTPLPDGSYSAVRGYVLPRDGCPERVPIEFVKISDGTIRFESGGSIWAGTIGQHNGVIRIEAGGVTPRPSAALNIRGHHTNAELYSGVCGRGYFRIVR